MFIYCSYLFQGDIGSAVYHNNTIVGIVSRVARHDAKIEHFTNVSEFLDYIKYEKKYKFSYGYPNDLQINESPAWAINFIKEEKPPSDLINDVPESTIFD